jgi:hypothetical protein
MKGIIQAVLAGMAVFGIGCALFIDKEARYLRSAVDRARQEEVRQELGPPLLMKSTKAREMVWVYQIRQAEKGGNNIWTLTGFWCDEYVLTFDPQGVLRHWTHQSNKHRDERWPTDCVKDGFKPTDQEGP